MSWTDKTTNIWIIKQIRSKFSLKAEMPRLKLFYFRYTVLWENLALEKVAMMGKVEEKRRE